MPNINLFKTPEEAFDYIKEQGSIGSNDFDILNIALAMGLVFLPGINIDRYRQHIKKMLKQLKDEFNTALEYKKEDSLNLRVEIMRKVINDINEYSGDENNYDDIDNANIIRVIEHRKGLPVSLGIIYISLAQKMGWSCGGISFPGHFLIYMELNGERLILNPFEILHEMQASDLRSLLKSIVGEKAELSHNFYNPVSNREVLLRLENNLKKRFIDMEDYSKAVRVAEIIEAFSPNEYRIYFDESVLYAKLGRIKEAVSAIEKYIDKTPNKAEKEQALLLLEEINMNL